MRLVVYTYIDEECHFATGQPWIGAAEHVARVVGELPTDGGQYDVLGRTYRTWRVDAR